MAELENDMKRLSTSSQEHDDEDFGYVKRDRTILHRALSSKSSPRATVDNVNQDGSQVSGEGPSPEVSDGTSVTTHQGEKAMESDSTEHNSARTERKFEIVKESVLSRKFAQLDDNLDFVEADEKDSSPPLASLIPSVVDSETGNAKNTSEKSPPKVSRSSGAKKSSSKPTPKTTMSGGKPREEQETEKIVSLPQSFQVKYLGQRDASGLWGIKHTRKPVDYLVSAARTMNAGTVLPMVRLLVSKEGVSVLPLVKSQEVLRFHAIDTISYGVQDLVYTRVFCIIVVREGGSAQGKHPFECHAFVCDSRRGARELTYALSAAFKEFSKSVKESGDKASVQSVKKKFAIDLRSPEEIEADLRAPEDSEA